MYHYPTHKLILKSLNFALYLLIAVRSKISLTLPGS